LKFRSPSTQRNRLRLLGYSAQSRTQREAMTCLARLHATPPGKQATSKRFVSQSGGKSGKKGRNFYR
ncbi:MAG: hypothetical protein QNJ47_28255, partial [Nostocaceae cyanobacterium]|nr:hypothetical protein [Nostocaceae cyanobacterium]